MFREMDPPCNKSITKSSFDILNLGKRVNCLWITVSTLPPPNSLASWLDGDYVLHLLPYGEPTSVSVDCLSLPMHQLIYEGGLRSAVWLLGSEAVCKVQAWKEGMQSESETIAFVREHFPAIPIPEVIYSWIDKSINRSFLIMKRVHARTLDSAWAHLTYQQRLGIANEVARYTATLASKTCCRFQTVSGCGVGIPSLIEGYPHESPIHNWFPRTIDPCSAAEMRAYMRNISSVPPPECEDPFVLFHDDQGPTNVLVSDDGNKVAAIIDWANAAYLPPFWVATVPFAHGGFKLSKDNPDSWAKMLVTALETHGFTNCIKDFCDWRRHVSERDTEKDKAEWHNAQLNNSRNL